MASSGTFTPWPATSNRDSPKNSPVKREWLILGSARASRAGDDALVIADFSCPITLSLRQKLVAEKKASQPAARSAGYPLGGETTSASALRLQVLPSFLHCSPLFLQFRVLFSFGRK
jgi:hypothetical protein